MLKDVQLNYRADGRIEWQCSHNIGHTIYAPKGSDYVHGCDRCEKIMPYKKIASLIREMIPCEKCGKTPIEWHNPNHILHRHRRISSLVNRGSYLSFLQEIRDSTPLCRSCHMKEDGRIMRLVKNSPYQKGMIYVQKQPCICCGKETKPLRKGLCYNCYENHRENGRNYKGHIYQNGCCKKMR